MQYLPDLRSIALFVQVLRLGSFTKAAKQLGISTNAVSRKVMALEAELGVRLLVRSTRSLSGTEEGRMLFSLAEKSVEELMSARHALKTRLESVKGTVRIALPSILATSRFLESIQVAQDRYAGLDFQILISDGILEQIRESVDISIEPGPLRDTDRTATLLGGVAWRLAASRAYIERQGAPKTPAELAKHDCLAFVGKKRQVQWRLVNRNGKSTDIRLNSRFASNDSRFLREALLAGLGIGPIAPGELEQGVRAGILASVLPEYHFAEANDVYAVYAKNSNRIPRIRVGIELLSQCVKALVD
jgi:DNA-binding transcriptional LysR family regulator